MTGDARPSRREHLPGNDVGVMFEHVMTISSSCADIAAAPALCDEVDGLGSAAHEDDFICRRGTEEAADLVARIS